MSICHVLHDEEIETPKGPEIVQGHKAGQKNQDRDPGPSLPTQALLLSHAFGSRKYEDKGAGGGGSDPRAIAAGLEQLQAKRQCHRRTRQLSTQ